jgi:Restriction Endonuclease associating with ARP
MALSFAARLRNELSESNQRYSQAHACTRCESPGGVILYEPDNGSHGNFLPTTYKAILAEPGWRRRLDKQHSHRRNLPTRASGAWRELDSCISSDALLMNVFCYPKAFSGGRLSRRLGVPADARPRFGFRARVPLLGDRFDRTEVDMKLGDLLVESKLTENDFQAQSKAVVEQYRDFAEVFDRRALPQTREQYLSYQLIRNVLAAHALEMSFCVLLDIRRPDLLEEWHAVMRAVRPVSLRPRCKTLTWQELAADLPPRQRCFLAEKYGIEAVSAARA